jgi:hypothetical protein
MPQNQKMKDRLMESNSTKAPPIPKGHPYHQDFKQKITPLEPKKPKASKNYQAKEGDWTPSKLPKAMYSKKGTGLNPSYK